MKKLLRNIGLFSIPFLMVPILEAFVLPVSLFTHRGWEALGFRNKIMAMGHFYPNFNLVIKEQGDLAHHTDKTVVKNCKWITDEIGYRNETFMPDPDIILIGDSFFGGCSLSQEETLRDQLAKLLGPRVKVYNMSPGSLLDFDRLYQEGLMKKPKLIIYSIVERNIPPEFAAYHKRAWKTVLKDVLSYHDMHVSIDRMLRLYSEKWIKTRIEGAVQLGTPSPINPDVFFLQGTKLKHMAEPEMEQAYTGLASCKQYCDQLGIDFLFVPMPDKEIVYYDLVPLPKQPDYAYKIDTFLQNRSINNINVLDIYNRERKQSNEMLYHVDDTHWNGHATRLVAAAIARHPSVTRISNLSFKSN